MDLSISNIHTIIFILSFIGIVLSIFQMYFHKEYIGYILAPFTYLIDLFLYNLFLHLNLVWGISIVSLEGLEVWSSVIRLHSLFLFIAYIVLQPTIRRGVKG